jgi:rhamnulokinase
MATVAAVDLGATSGRVVLATYRDGAVSLEEVARFPNHPEQRDGRWVWDTERLLAATVSGLATAVERGSASFGVDTWGVDFGVIRDGERLGPVRAYRDPLNEQGLGIVEAVIPWHRLYSLCGIQRMPINTIYQVAVDDPPRLTAGSTFLPVPDLVAFLITGVAGTDVTHASTSSMVSAGDRTWSTEVLDALGLPHSAFLQPDEPGTLRGPALVPGLRGLPHISVGAHDTASAYAGTPIVDRERALVLSLGTWALIGAECVGVLPTEAARELNVTHELGVDGTLRVLRNVTGMWLLEECRRSWGDDDGEAPAVLDLIDAATQAPAFAGIIDVDLPELGAPGQSPATLAPRIHGSWDGTRGGLTRILLESLVARVADRARQITYLLGGERDVLHVVGGASRLPVVMQWLADATDMRVVAGPTEATALGNAIVQWRALGAVSSLAEARRAIAALPEIREYTPSGTIGSWRRYAERLHESA